MTPSSMNRAEVKACIKEMVESDARSAAVTVSYGSPPEGQDAEGIWFGRVSGPHSVPNQKAGRIDRTDEFAITVWCWVAMPGMTCEAAELRAQEMFGIVEDVLADHPKLDGRVSGLLWARLTDVTLDSFVLEDEGFGGYVMAEIAAKSRLT